MLALTLLLFSTFWLAIIYILNCCIARKFLGIEPFRFLINVLTMAALGLFGEVTYDTIYAYLCGNPLWEYHLLPIHNGYTSVYSLFLWGMVGAHLYFLHTTLERRSVTSLHALAFIFCVEAILLEAAVNVTYLGVFKDYIYYYLPNDLWHITSLQTLPLYLLAGYITVVAMGHAWRLPRIAILGNGIVLAVLLILK